ncbi:MAG: hypothetical protein P4L50_12525, partial [Anaerolineaceae bacterium]|nr:hypothetical protein [Anaerolineaceae bacterium]
AGSCSAGTGTLPGRADALSAAWVSVSAPVHGGLRVSVWVSAGVLPAVLHAGRVLLLAVRG